MKNKARLAFEMLEQEMEVIGREKLVGFKGGDWFGEVVHNPTEYLSNFLTSLIGTTSTSAMSQFTQLNSNNFVGQNGITTYTGAVATLSNPNALVTLDTTVDNGHISSYTPSLGGVISVSYLTEVGYSFGITVNGTTHTSSMSLERGFLLGASVSSGAATSGYEVNHVQGWGDVALGLCIAAAIETGGASLALYPELSLLFFIG